MVCIRPATPGFLVTLVAAILLAVVSFCVPYFQSVYFLKASIVLPGNLTGSITFGTLGYCLELPTNGTTCSKPSIGYELDINGLVGNSLPIEIPQVAVKWITYALFLHVVALILATGSAAFGLLAHIREMSMTCCSTFVSGIAAAVALLAFIFDLVLFFVAKARINAVGSASMGNAIWLTLAAWILLFFSGCFYTLGRCCVSSRPRNGGAERREGQGKDSRYDTPPKNDYAEEMRLDAVKAEADRKVRQKQKEGGLPAFSETQPLTARIEGDHVYLDNYESSDVSGSTVGSTARKPSQHTLKSVSSGPRSAPAGYVQGAPGTTAIDEYYNPTTTAANTYPPQPQRQDSFHQYGPSGYSSASPYAGAPMRQPSGYEGHSAPLVGGYGYQSTSPPPTLGVPGQAYNDPYASQGQMYGHTQGGSSYHTAAGHSQQPSAVAYAQYDYDQQQRTYSSPAPQIQTSGYLSPQPLQQYTSEQPAFLNPAAGNNYAPTAMATGYSPAQSQSAPQGYNYPERQYTLSGDGYTGGYDPYSAYTSNAAAADDSAAGGGHPPAGSPPEYEQGGSGAWGKQ